jgi:hypothetical protein
MIRKLFLALIGCLAIAPVADAALVGRTVTIVATPQGDFDLRFPDGDNGGATPPTAPELGQPSVVSDTEIDITLAVAATGGTAPLSYELSTSTDPFCLTDFTVFDADADFDGDGIYRLSGLNDETTYCMRLAAIDSDTPPLRSAFSPVIVATTQVTPTPGDVTAPTLPTNVVVTSTVAFTADISWTASTDAVGVCSYKVTQGLGDGAGNPVGTGTLIATLVGAPPVTSYQVTGLTEDQEYWYRIEGVDCALNESGKTAHEYVTVIGAPDPPPQGVSDTPDYVDPIAATTLAGGRVTVNSTNSADFAADINAAACGETIVAPAGTMTNSATMDTDCPATNPVIVKGQAAFGTVVGTSITVNGDQGIITGLDFNHASARLILGGANVHAVGNKFRNWGNTATCNAIAITIQTFATDPEIAYNELGAPGPWSTGTCTAPQGRQGVRTQDSGATDTARRIWMHHNYVHDFPTKPIPSSYDSGQCDWIETGQTQQGTYPAAVSGHYIEDNYILRHYMGHGCFDAKVGGLVFRRNTMIDSRTTVGGTTLNCRSDNRTSSTNRSIFEANWHETSGGMTIHGTVSLYGNVLVNTNTGYKILAGTSDCSTLNCQQQPGMTQALCKHGRACEVILEGNTGPIIVGEDESSPNCTFPARNTTIRDHTGGVTLQADKPGSVPCQTGTNAQAQWTTASGRLYQRAVKGTVGQVGPGALSSSSAQYRAARGL